MNAVKNTFLKTSIAGLVMLFGRPGSAPASTDIDWQSFLGRHDLIWSEDLGGMGNHKARNSKSYAFIGNAHIGAALFYSQFDSLFVWRLGRQDAYAVGDNSHIAKHGIGDLVIPLRGKLTGGVLRQNLWDATVSAKITTTEGTLSFETFTHAEDDLLIVNVRTGGNEDGLFRFDPFDSTATVEVEEEIRHCVQPYLYSGDRTVAWTEHDRPDGERTLLLSIESTSEGSSREECRTTVGSVTIDQYPDLETEHREWWHDFYRRHFFSIPDTRLESLYWIGIYRIGSMFRPNGPMVDNSGLWLDEEGRWTRLTCDMNAQVMHMPLYPANLGEHSRPMIRALNNNIQNLRANVSDADPECIGLQRHVTLELLSHAATGELGIPQITLDDIPDDFTAGNLKPGVTANDYGHDGEDFANLGWLLYDYYQYYRTTMDEQVARDLFKLMKLNMRGFLYMLGEKAPDGMYHLAPMNSPEVGGGSGPDANYGLSVIRWLCNTLLELDERYDLNDSERDRWAEILENLTPYPASSSGFLVFPNVPIGDHRHWSHLLMIHPLQLVHWDNPADRDIMKKSVDYWVNAGMQERSWSMAAASAMYASMEDEKSALDWLQTGYKRLRANTNFIVKGNLNETPLMFVRSMQDMLLQSTNGIIRVFPAVPDEWSNAAFSDMRAEGNFTIDAIRRDGTVQFVRITSNAGEPCLVRAPFDGPITASGDRSFTITEHENNTYEIDLQRDETVLLFGGNEKPDTRISEVAHDGWINWWGDRRKNPDDVVGIRNRKEVIGAETIKFHVENEIHRVSIRLSKAERVTVSLVDMKGRAVGRGVEEILPAGTHDFLALDRKPGQPGLGRGIYLLSVTVNNRRLSRKIVVKNRM